MTTHASAPGRRDDTHTSGWLVFAAVIMIFSGIMTLLGGISAIAKDDVFLATRNYVYELDLTGWGWIHLILGILITLVGVALLTGATWARVVGVALAGISMIANFLWLPYTPWWALVIIAIDALVIWGLCVAPKPVRD
ncbi:MULTISPECIES: hypothetical protein [Streptomyces]|uniref:DUF7144 family membrane protein n=1 Tax=Streptomyces TaxID=1883 RepID=UPI00093A6F0E|nr:MULTISPECIES: hypothetical protein [Streptomyces]MBX9421391.1 hypothetical protein [Streptomyces lateritius]OKJ66325.1 hypothetical protein AMK29_16920 [Streptomyces sp. CB02261]